MEKKDSRDREREPEEYNFNYEELAGTEDLDTEETAEDGEFEEYGEEDDFDEDEGIVFRFKPWMIPVFAGMVILDPDLHSAVETEPS